jgi:hypothetical protein
MKNLIVFISTIFKIVILCSMPSVVDIWRVIPCTKMIGLLKT